MEVPADVTVIPVNAFVNAEGIRRVALPKEPAGKAGPGLTVMKSKSILLTPPMDRDTI